MRIVSRRACTHLVFTVLGFVTLASGSAAAEPEKAAESAAKKYTATAYLLVERHEPHILPRSAEKDDPADFESYRATQMQLFKSPYVLIAALRDPKVQKQPGIKREEARHRAVAWLGKEIRVKCPDTKSGVVNVSLTSSDPNEAAVLVNAVVKAYINEVVDVERQMRRDRLSDLQQISAEKENEVRTRREQLKRELETIGAGDEQTMAARMQLAMGMYAEFQREFQRMRGERRVLLGQLQVAKWALEELPNTEIAEIEVVAILNNNPRYRDLQSRVLLLEQNLLRHSATPPGKKPSPAYVRAMADLETTKAQLETLVKQSRDQIREALRIELRNDVRRLDRQLEISTGKLAGFEKEVEVKGNEVDSLGRSTVGIQMAQGRRRYNRTGSSRRDGGARNAESRAKGRPAGESARGPELAGGRAGKSRLIVMDNGPKGRAILVSTSPGNRK